MNISNNLPYIWGTLTASVNSKDDPFSIAVTKTTAVNKFKKSGMTRDPVVAF